MKFVVLKAPMKQDTGSVVSFFVPNGSDLPHKAIIQVGSERQGRKVTVRQDLLNAQPSTASCEYFTTVQGSFHSTSDPSGLGMCR